MASKEEPRVIFAEAMDEEDLAEAEARGCTLQEWREIKYCPE